MDNVPVTPDLANVEPAAPPVRPICGFWIRLLAFLIDVLILRVVGVLLGALFGYLFFAMGNFSRLIGLAIVLTYFGLMQSRTGGGQSLGQRVTRIRVVGRDGECISVGRSMCRTAILWLPALLNQPIMSLRALMSPVGVVLGVVWTVIAAGLVYFYLFNRITRQSIHDLICCTFVVKADAEAPMSFGRVSRIHCVVFPSIIAALAVLGTLAALALASGPLKTMFTLADRIGNVRGGTVVGVNENYWFSSDGNRYHTLQVTAVPSLDADPQKLASEIGKKVVRECGNTSDFDGIAVDVLSTYSILIHRVSSHRVWLQSPEDWQAGAKGAPEMRWSIDFF
jgi:uncharacterized RDD family membrane protein YckC